MNDAARRIGSLLPGWLIGPLPIAALVVGLLERFGWALHRRIETATGEAAYVAAALGGGRGFADAYMPGQGPTAHLLPISPMVAGGVYGLFGVQTVTSETLLLIWSVGLVFATFTLFGRCMERLGSPRGALVAGFAVLAVLPIYTTYEVFDFRVWEGALGLFLGGSVLVLLVSPADGARSRFYLTGLAVLPALAFFVSPPVGLAAIAAVALFLLRARDVRAAVRVLGGMSVALALLMGAWTARNMIVMGHPIFLRDNFGLELAVGNFPEANNAGDPEKIFYDHLARIHPRDEPLAFARMVQAGGEYNYAKKMGRETWAWMVANPGATAEIWIRHAREMVFTRTWLFQTRRGVWMPVFRATVVTILACLGLLGLVGGMSRDPRYWYVAAYVAIPVFCYIPFQPIARYTWLLYPVFAYLATDFVWRLASRWRGSPVRP